MRQIILDTETTGLNPKSGDRIIEIGCLELINRRLTGQHFHSYLNPECEISAAATAVHGLRLEDLLDKPKFAQKADELLAFVRDAEVIIHNAPFDVAFLDAELQLIGRKLFKEHCRSVTDSLRLAKELYPGKRNSLDALCERYKISNAHRSLHGALLDAELLAAVYLAMTRGQNSLMIESAAPATTQIQQTVALENLDLKVLAASAQECAEHEALLDDLEKEFKKPPIWRIAGAK